MLTVGDDVITAVAAEAAVEDPRLLVPVTVTENVVPTSLGWTA